MWGLTMEARACSCQDFVQPEFFNEVERRARKEHRCTECGQPIVAGEQYFYTSAKWDGVVCSVKTCKPCAQIRDDYCGPYSSLREYIIELLGVDLV